MKSDHVRRMLAVLRFILLFPPVFCIAFWLMLPALLEQRVPVWRWPSAVLYGLLVGGKR